MTLEPNIARELARRLVARAAAERGTPDGASVSIHAACERAYNELARWLGPVGSHALITRAIAEARIEHPFLSEIQIGGPSEPGLQGVTAAAAVHGDRAVAAALGAVLETLLELLGRLIGDDLAMRLLGRDALSQSGEDENPK